MTQKFMPELPRTWEVRLLFKTQIKDWRKGYTSATSGKLQYSSSMNYVQGTFTACKYRISRAQTPNSWTYNFVQVSDQNLESSQTWKFPDTATRRDVNLHYPDRVTQINSYLEKVSTISADFSAEFSEPRAQSFDLQITNHSVHPFCYLLEFSGRICSYWPGFYVASSQLASYFDRGGGGCEFESPVWTWTWRW